MGIWTAQFCKHWHDHSAIDIDLEGTTGEFSITVLFGSSGEGKTTTLRCLAGLERPDSGEILFEGETWFSETTQLPPQRRGVGLLLQDRVLFPHLTVAGNVAYGLQNLGRDERDRRVRDLLASWDILPLADRYPRQISGGEQQRTALARTLAVQPRMLLLDEPLSSLDEPSRERLGSELRRHLEEYAIPVVFVTHRRDEALALGDRICVMHGGRTVQTGSMGDVFNQPHSAEVAAILGWHLFPAGEVVSNSGGMSVLEIEGSRITVSGSCEVGSKLRWGIRTDDLRIITQTSFETFGENVLSGRLLAIRPDERGVRVNADLGLLGTVSAVAPRGTDLSALRMGEEIRLGFSSSACRLLDSA